MTPRKKALIIAASILIALGGIYGAYRFLSERDRLLRGFPLLEPGAYVGAIEYDQERGRSETIYLERLREGDTFLAILFREGFQPQTLFPERIGRSQYYRPLVLRLSDGSFRLSGVEDELGFHGVVRNDSNEVGKWTLRKMGATEVATDTLGDRSASVTSWVQAKERARTAEKKFEDLEARRAEAASRLQLLERSLSDESSLRVRAEERRKELEAELAQIREERDRAGKAVETLASEAELLARIMKRGQAVSLERRIVQRENRWYDVNWQSEEELGQEELPDSGIDLEKLDQAVRRARETKSLIREREEELRKIREIERGGSSSTASSVEERGSEAEPTPPPTKTEPQKENLWDRLFN